MHLFEIYFLDFYGQIVSVPQGAVNMNEPGRTRSSTSSFKHSDLLTEISSFFIQLIQFNWPPKKGKFQMPQKLSIQFFIKFSTVILQKKVLLRACPMTSK